MLGEISVYTCVSWFVGSTENWSIPRGKFAGQVLWLHLCVSYFGVTIQEKSGTFFSIEKTARAVLARIYIYNMTTHSLLC